MALERTNIPARVASAYTRTNAQIADAGALFGGGFEHRRLCARSNALWS